MNKPQLMSHLRKQGFSENIVKAFEKVKREEFVLPEHKAYTYEDNPLPIGFGATISQPYTIAFMLDKLELEKNPKLKVLEIGSGSGYVLALLKEITKGKIYGVEIIKELVDKSKETLKKLNYKNIKVINKSGFKGLPENAPYDRILVSAACSNLETAKNLVSQLKENGIIVASVKWSVFKIKKEKGEITEVKEFPGFAFVPLVEES